MKLYDLLENIVDEKVPDLEISHVSCDSRQVVSGTLFFAVPGTVTDGAQYIAEAIHKGASAIVYQVEGRAHGSVPHFKVDDVRQTMAKVAARFYHEPSLKFYLCGVTGTNGKTTTTYLLEKIWFEEVIGVIGTINARYKKTILPATHTTPDVFSTQKIFSDMVQEGITAAVMEVSSHALEQKRVLSCHFDSVIFTNLTQDHLDYHKNMEAYYQAKKLLFSELLRSSKKDSKLAVVNLDDEYGVRLVKEVAGTYEIKTFSVKNPKADIFVKTADYSIGGTRAEIILKGKSKKIETNLLGEHNLKNIMAAVLVALHRGAELDFVCDQVIDVRVPGRLERVLNSGFFVDYAHTPDALENVITALRKIMKRGRLIVVFGCGGDRDKAKRPLMGKVCAELADVALVTSDNPRTENAMVIISDILPGMNGKIKSYDDKTGMMVEVDRKKALEMAVRIAEPDDVVLVAGKGHEDYQIIGTEKLHFDDREILTELIIKKENG